MSLNKSKCTVTDAKGNQVLANASFVTTDGTNASPLTVSNVVKTLTLPAGAVRLWVSASGADVRVSELAAMTNYVVVRAAFTYPTPFDCASMTTISLIRDAGVDVTVSYWFELLDN